MSDCKHNWSGWLHCADCGAEQSMGHLQAEIESLTIDLKSVRAANERLMSENRVLQDDIYMLKSQAGEVES